MSDPDIVPLEQQARTRRRAAAKKPRARGQLILGSDGRSARMMRGDGSGFIDVVRDGNALTWATREYVPTDLLDRLKASRDLEARAPTGDSSGAWQKVAEIPTSLLLSKVPFDAWGDERAVNKVLNDPDLRAFRADGNHRRV